jgi:hypothetical protein
MTESAHELVLVCDFFGRFSGHGAPPVAEGGSSGVLACGLLRER